MGSFWGMNDAGKDAAGFPRQYGAWNWDQYEQSLNQGNRYGDLADFYNQGVADYLTQRRNEGFASPHDITATGREISPWVQDYIANETARRQSIKDRESGRRTTGEVSSEMSSRLDGIGQSIGDTYTGQEGEINDTARRAFGREDAAHGDIVNNIKGSSNSLRGAINDTFTGLRKDNSRTYDDIRKYGQSSFADQESNLELIKPGSQMQGARVARSFAPQMADTLMRLRRSGIDPNSPEAASLLRGVETSRSRAMDDASADATESFVTKKNDISNSRLGFDTAASRARLENEAGLATGQVDRSNVVSSKEADDFNNQTRTHTSNSNLIDRDRSERTYDNTDTAFQRAAKLALDRNGLTNWTRSADMEDVDRAKSNTEGDAASELTSGKVYDNQFDRGLAWQGINQSTKDNAVSNLGNLAGRYGDYGFRSKQQAMQFGDAANRGYSQSYAMEAPKAGWGARLLGGLAAGALNYFAPGAGTALTGGLNSGGSTNTGGGRTYGGGTTFGSGAGGGNPYVFSYLQPQQYQMPRMPEYDPAKTRTLPNGNLQVGTYPSRQAGRTY